MSEDDWFSAILTYYTRNVPEMSPFTKDRNFFHKKYVTSDNLTTRSLLVGLLPLHNLNRQTPSLRQLHLI